MLYLSSPDKGAFITFIRDHTLYLKVFFRLGVRDTINVLLSLTKDRTCQRTKAALRASLVDFKGMTREIQIERRGM